MDVPLRKLLNLARALVYLAMPGSMRESPALLNLTQILDGPSPKFLADDALKQMDKALERLTKTGWPGGVSRRGLPVNYMFYVHSVTRAVDWDKGDGFPRILVYAVCATLHQLHLTL